MTEEQLRAAVRELLLRNVTDGYSGLLGQSYCYIAPALKRYPFQWFWDTCFHVVMLARLQTPLARQVWVPLADMIQQPGKKNRH